MVDEREKWLFWKAAELLVEHGDWSLKKTAKVLGVKKSKAAKILAEVRAENRRTDRNRENRKRNFPTLEFWNDLRQRENKYGILKYFVFKGWEIIPRARIRRDKEMCRLECRGSESQIWKDPDWHEDFESAQLALFEYLNPPEGFRKSMMSPYGRRNL